MRELPFSEHEQNAALYVAALGTLFTFITAIESSHALWRGCVAGAIGSGMLLAIWALVRARRTYE